MANLLITVVVPTYNRYKDLENLIKTFLLQDYSNSELLIIDDLGSPKIGEVSRRWMRESKKILYHKNQTNLGITANIRNAFKIAHGDVIVFMGDDDIFIDDNALALFAEAFSNKKIGIAKGSQILFKNGKVNQAFSLKRKEKNIIYYQGLDIFEKIWFESMSFTGLAFRNNSKVREMISNSITLYPQVELTGFVSLWYGVAEINKYVVGVQSHPGQLNCTYYDINEVRTNILEDWLHIYKKIKLTAEKHNVSFMGEKTFIKKLTFFNLYFLPYNTLTNGRIETTMFTLNILRYNRKIFFVSFFWISAFISIFLPKKLIQFLIEVLKRIRLEKQLSHEELIKINLLLRIYYNGFKHA